MANITLHGDAFQTIGDLPKAGSQAGNFQLVKSDLSEISKDDYKNKNLILNIFPSIDTGTCAASVRRFNKEASQLKDTVVLCISADLPFAAARFCGAEGIDNVETASVFRNPEFAKDYAVGIVSGPLKGLLSRAVIVIDKNNSIVHSQQVSEIADEPDYESALNSLK